MAGSRKLIVEIIGDSSSLEKAFRKSTTASESWSHKIGRAAKAAAIGIGVVAVAAGGLAFAIGKQAVSAAANLQQSIFATNRIFGRSAAGIRKWSQNLADSMGL